MGKKPLSDKFERNVSFTFWALNIFYYVTTVLLPTTRQNEQINL